jgi:hypothetical protein
MPKPERILLQEKNQRNHATLANGVKCGEEAAFPEQGREFITGWRDYISFSGQLMSGFFPSAGPDSDPDQLFRVAPHAKVGTMVVGGYRPGFAGKRILGLMTNGVMPDLVRLVLDVGDDPQQPGQLECETIVTSTRELDPQLIETLQFLRMLPEDFKP